jgi:hypothetical protein
MPTTIENFLKQHNMDDPKLASYDDDTKQIIAEIINGEVHKYADSENGAILLYIGIHYGIIKHDENSAEKYYLLAAKHNASRALVYLGDIYYYRDLDLSEQYYLMAAEHNETVAMCSLGRMYGAQKKLDLASETAFGRKILSYGCRT